MRPNFPIHEPEACAEKVGKSLMTRWSPTGKPVVPKNHTHLRQGFGGSSADQRNPPKHDTIVSYGDSIRSYAFLHGQGRGLLRRRMKKSIPIPVRSMLVIHQGALGDFILALPSLEILRKTFPRARSVFMGYPRILELVENRFYAEEMLSIDQKGMASFFVRGGALDLNLSQFFKTFDLIVVFGKDRDGSLIGNLNRVCQKQILPIQSFPCWDERIHLTDHLLREFSHYGFSTPEGIPKIYLNGADQRWGEQYWTGNGVTPKERAGVVILHPGSGSKKKVWALDRFLDLMKHLQRRFHSRVLVVLGPAEGAEIRDSFEGSPGAPILARGLSLIQLASVMEGCRLFIGNDSGVSHLAAALGIPTVAIFGPTDPKVWSPKGRNIAVVRQEIPCSPCPQERFFQCRHFECLKGVEMEHVLDGIRTVGFGKEASRKEVNDGGKEGW